MRPLLNYSMPLRSFLSLHVLYESPKETYTLFDTLFPTHGPKELVSSQASKSRAMLIPSMSVCRRYTVTRVLSRKETTQSLEYGVFLFEYLSTFNRDLLKYKNSLGRSRAICHATEAQTTSWPSILNFALCHSPSDVTQLRDLAPMYIM